MFQKSIFILISWLLLISVVSCAQVEVDNAAQNTLATMQVVDASPSDESADEVEVVPTPTNSTTEPAGSPGEDATSTATPQPTAIPGTSTQNNEEEEAMATQSIDQGTEKLVSQAIEDLAQRLNVTPEQIEVVEIQTVTWPDASLGCPQSGMMYAQIVTQGYRIMLTVEDKTYEYHTDTQRQVIYCETPEARLLINDQSTESIKQAKEDLTRRLGISADSIEVVVIIRQEFPANAFYCRTQKERIARDEAPTVISGETILLKVGERKYEYHASDQTVIFCRQLSE